MLGHSLQTKLRVNEPGDQFEQEADRVAAQVMRMPDASVQAQPLQSEPVIQRFVEDSGRQTGEGTMQRADEAGKESAPAGEQSASGGAAPKDGSLDDGGSRCPSWRADPESISKRAAENYVQHDITPPSQATVEKIRCEPPIANGNYGNELKKFAAYTGEQVTIATSQPVIAGPTERLQIANRPDGMPLLQLKKAE